MRIAGRCHCGNIAFDLTWPDGGATIPARACGCTFCTKHGGVWTSHPAATLAVTVRTPEDVEPYQFGTRTAVFRVCRRCGVVPLVTSRIAEHDYAVVNVNTLTRMLNPRPKNALVSPRVHQATLNCCGGVGGSAVGAGSVVALMTSSGWSGWSSRRRCLGNEQGLVSARDSRRADDVVGACGQQRDDVRAHHHRRRARGTAAPL